MKGSDIIATTLKNKGVKNVHAVTGGAIVHIIDSCVRIGLNVYYYNHEQAAAFAAVAESKVTSNPSVCLCTTGPGGTNTITGLLGAWQDSMPTVFISGNARLEHITPPGSVRQVGTQEFNITELVKPITKKALILHRLDLAERLVSELFDLSTSQRKGPVWLDVPLNLQYEELLAEKSIYAKSGYQSLAESRFRNPSVLQGFLRKISNSSRPFFLIGGGFPVDQKSIFIQELENAGIPYGFTYNSLTSSLLPNSNFHTGVLGIAGTRHSNYIAFHSDHIICLGTHVPVPITGADHRIWCSHSIKSIVNSDIQELIHHRVKFDCSLHYTCEEIMEDIISVIRRSSKRDGWSKFCQDVLDVAEPLSPSAHGFLDLYQFFYAFNDFIETGFNIVVDGGGTVNSAAFSRLKPPVGCSLTMSSAICSMGSGLPELIGSYLGLALASLSAPKYNILLVGDGSIAFNVQELLTLTGLNIPFTIFVFNNSGYLSIRNTLDSFLGGRYNGVDKGSGLPLYSISSLASIHGVDYHHINSIEALASYLGFLRRHPSTRNIVEIMVSPTQLIGPVQKFEIDSKGNGRPLPLAFMHPELELPSPSWTHESVDIG